MGAWFFIDEGASTRTTAAPFNVTVCELSTRSIGGVHGNAYSDFLWGHRDLHSHFRIKEASEYDYHYLLQSKQVMCATKYFKRSIYICGYGYNGHI